MKMFISFHIDFCYFISFFSFTDSSSLNDVAFQNEIEHNTSKKKYPFQSYIYLFLLISCLTFIRATTSMGFFFLLDFESTINYLSIRKTHRKKGGERQRKEKENEKLFGVGFYNLKINFKNLLLLHADSIKIFCKNTERLHRRCEDSNIYTIGSINLYLKSNKFV
jgi:hypothetical protein